MKIDKYVKKNGNVRYKFYECFDAAASFTELAKAEEFRRSQEIEHQVMIAN